VLLALVTVSGCLAVAVLSLRRFSMGPIVSCIRCQYVGLVLCLSSCFACPVVLVLLFVSLVLLGSSVLPCLHAVDRSTACQFSPAPLGSLFPLAIDLLALLVSSSVALLRVLPHVSSVPVLLWCSMYVSVCMALVLPSRT